MTNDLNEIWATPVWLGTENLTLADGAMQRATGGEWTHSAPVKQVLSDPDAVSAALDRALQALTADPAGIDLRVEIWRPGFSIGLAYGQAAWQAWCPLAAVGADPANSSGTLSLHDPRSGCATMAGPGLPWGRPLTIKPEPGIVVVYPGWLGVSSTPVRAGHTVMILVADLHAHTANDSGGKP